MRHVIPLVAIFIGFVGLAASCIYMENPWGVDELYYGYPLLWLNTSKSLLFVFPPIPKKIIVLPGFFIDLLLYSSVGVVVSYMVFTLNENMRLLKFFLKSGAVFLASSFFAGFVLTAPGPTPTPGVGPIGIGVGLALIFSLPATYVCTIAYGYYRIFINWRAKRKTASSMSIKSP